jgi:hypothetical protein
MTNKSWRHHYLPVFYLNGFTKGTKQFKIYNVQKGHFVKNGKEFSTNSYFFEQNANSFISATEKDDFLETDFYSHFDNKVSKLFETINTSDQKERYSISEKEMPILQHFVSLMYWRLPHKKNEIDYFLNNYDLSDFGLTVFDKNGTRNLDEEIKLKNNSEFRKGFRFYMSLIDSVRGIECRSPYTILETTDQLPFLCSDNPVLFRKRELPKVFEDNFIFPLNGNKLFIKANMKADFDIFTRLWTDILVFKQAVKYVSCTDSKYIQVLEDYYCKHFKSEEELREQLFDRIEKNAT